MDIINQLIDFILHLDSYLYTMILEYGYWIYLILFLIVFVETGLVVMPLLPGDSLLFAAGTFCAGVVHNGQTAELNIFIVIPLLICAALIGDNLNYYINTLHENTRHWIQLQNIKFINEFISKYFFNISYLF